MQKRNLPKALIILVLSFISFSAKAKYIDLTAAAEKKKTIVSGVLNPPSVSVNGAEIPQKPGVYSALLINGAEAPTNDTVGLKTFYEVVEGDQILLQWKTKKESLVSILEFSYPAVQKMELLHTEFAIQFNDKTKKVKYDGIELDITNPRIQVPSTQDWIETPHTLELYSTDNISRIYNLDFSKYKEDLLTMASWSIVKSDPPLDGNNRPPMYGVSSRVLRANNLSHEIFAGTAKTTYTTGAGMPWQDEISQQVFELKYKFGINPFQTNSGDINYRRLTLGIHASLINYKRTSNGTTLWLDGYNETQAETWYNQGGYFVRWEPLQYKSFGVFISVDHRVFRSQKTIRSDSTPMTIGLSYYFDPDVLKRITSGQPLEF